MPATRPATCALDRSSAMKNILVAGDLEAVPDAASRTSLGLSLENCAICGAVNGPVQSLKVLTSLWGCLAGSRCQMSSRYERAGAGEEVCHWFWPSVWVW